MPTSDLHNLLFRVIIVFGNLRPRSILDIGCGFGKYGVLLREYLDISEQRIKKSDWRVRIEGLDAFEDYRNPIWDFVYDKVHVGDIQDLVPSLARYDAILIADMIEHLEKPAAMALVGQLHQRCGTLVISTPKEFYPQPSTNGNDFEIHRCLWRREDYPEGINVVSIWGLGCNVYVSSKQPIDEDAYRASCPHWMCSIPAVARQTSRSRPRGVAHLRGAPSSWSTRDLMGFAQSWFAPDPSQRSKSGCVDSRVDF